MTRGLERHILQVLGRGRSPCRFLDKRPCYVTQAGGAGRGRGRGIVAPADQGWPPAGIGHGTVEDAPSFGRGRGYGIINVSERIGRLEAPPRVGPDQVAAQSQEGQLPDFSTVHPTPLAGIPFGRPRNEIPHNVRTWSASSQQPAKVNPVQFHQNVGNNPEQTMNTNPAQYHQSPEYEPAAFQSQAWPHGQLQNQPPTYHPYQYPNYYPPWPPQVVHHSQGTNIRPQQNLPLQVQPPQPGQTFSPHPLPHPVTTYPGEHPVPSAGLGQVQGSSSSVPYYQGTASASHQVPYQGLPPSQVPHGQMPGAAGQTLQHPDPRGNFFGTHAQAYQHGSFTGSRVGSFETSHQEDGQVSDQARVQFHHSYTRHGSIHHEPAGSPQYSQPYNIQPPSQNAPQYSQPYNAQPPSQNAPQYSQPYNVQPPSQDARGYPVYSAARESMQQPLMYQAPYQRQYPEFSQHQHQKATIHGGEQSSALPSDSSRPGYQAQVHPSPSQPQTQPQTQPYQHWQTVPGVHYPTHSHPQMPYQYGVPWYQGWYSNQLRPGLQPPPVAHSNVTPDTQTGIYQPSASSAIPQQQVVQHQSGPPEAATSADQVSAPVASPHYHPHCWPPPAQNFVSQPLSHPIPAQAQTVLPQGIQQEMVAAGVEGGSQSVSVGMPAVSASPHPRGTVSQLPLQQQAGNYRAVQVPGQQFGPPLGASSADQRAPLQAPQGDQSQASKAQNVGQPGLVSKSQIPVDAARAQVNSPQMAPHGIQPLSQTQTAAKDTQPRSVGQQIQSIASRSEVAGNLQSKVQTEPSVSTVITNIKDTKEDDSAKPSLGLKLYPRSVRTLGAGRGKPLELKNETTPGIDVSGEFVFRQPDVSLSLSLSGTNPEVDVRAHLPMPFESRLSRGRGKPLSQSPIGSQQRVTEMRKPQLSREEAVERALAILEKGMEKATMAAGSRERSKRLSMVPSGNLRRRTTDASSTTQTTGSRTAKTRRTRLQETEAEATDRWRKELALRNLTPEQAEAAETSMIFNKMVIDTYHTHCLYEFEPEYAMEDFGQNPVIEDAQPPTLEETIEKAKPLLMPLGGFMDDKQWEDTVQEVIKDVPSLKKIVERYAGPPRKTANQQNRELEAIAAKLPAYVPPELSAFTQRALITMKNNPSWNLLQKKQMMSNFVTKFATHS